MPAMSAFSAVDQEQRIVMVELEILRQHSISLAVNRRDGQSPVALEILTRIVKTLRPGTWISAEHRIDAITDVLAGAIEQLPDETLPGAAENSLITWRSAARILFQAPPLPFELFVAVKKTDSGVSAPFSAKAVRYVQQAAGLPSGEQATGDLTGLLHRELARILLQEEGKAMTTAPGGPGSSGAL